MQDEKGELVVCKAKKLEVRSGLPPGMDMSGVAKVDLDGVWICAEYWEAADGKTGAGYGGDAYTFLTEDTKLDADFFIFQGMEEKLRCRFAEADS